MGRVEEIRKKTGTRPYTERSNSYLTRNLSPDHEDLRYLLDQLDQANERIEVLEEELENYVKAIQRGDIGD